MPGARQQLALQHTHRSLPAVRQGASQAARQPPKCALGSLPHTMCITGPQDAMVVQATGRIIGTLPRWCLSFSTLPTCSSDVTWAEQGKCI